jgi:xylulokinase
MENDGLEVMMRMRGVPASGARMSMSREILLGIDLGTTVLKVAAYDARSGKAISQVSSRLPLRVGADGARGLAAPAIDRALRRAALALASVVGRDWRKVGGIGLATQGGSILFADRASGKALTPMILWSDSRGSEYLPRLLKQRPTAFWRKTILRDSPVYIMARMLWLRETQPRYFTNQNICVGAEGYAYFRLTGVWRQNPGHAIQIGCYNAREKRLDQRLYDLIGVPLSIVPPLRRGHEMNPLSKEGARLLLLPDGIPVVGPYHDQEAGYLSAAGASQRPLQCSLGTAWVGNFSLPERARWYSPTQLVLAPVIGTGWLVVQPLSTGNVAWDWGIEHFVGRDRDLALRKVARIFQDELLPPDGLTALPWFNAPNPLRPGAHGGGGFVGLNPNVGAAEMLRALAASLCFEMARMFKGAARSGAFDGIVLNGGAAQGSFFQRIMAAVFHPVPVYVALDPDLAGSRGAIYAFNPKAACGKTLRVAAPDRQLRERVEGHFEQYMFVLNRLLGKKCSASGLRMSSLH